MVVNFKADLDPMDPGQAVSYMERNEEEKEEGEGKGNTLELECNRICNRIGKYF